MDDDIDFFIQEAISEFTDDALSSAIEDALSEDEIAFDEETIMTGVDMVRDRFIEDEQMIPTGAKPNNLVGATNSGHGKLYHESCIDKDETLTEMGSRYAQISKKDRLESTRDGLRKYISSSGNPDSWMVANAKQKLQEVEEELESLPEDADCIEKEEREFEEEMTKWKNDFKQPSQEEVEQSGYYDIEKWEENSKCADHRDKMFPKRVKKQVNEDLASLGISSIDGEKHGMQAIGETIGEFDSMITTASGVSETSKVAHEDMEDDEDDEDEEEEEDQTNMF